jgi:t-SNARE complex subunit (syntaxin)
MNSIIALLAALVAFLFFQNKKLKRRVIDTDIKNEKENLDDAQKKSDSARNRFIDLLNKYRKGE